MSNPVSKIEPAPTNGTALAVISFETIERMALAVANSKLFGVKSKDEALALMLLAQAEGIHPMTAIREYHVINGRPSMKADTMLARFQQAGGVVKWLTLTDTKCEATFSHLDRSVTIDWTIERAAKAGLSKKDVWLAYPRAMLRSRVVSEGVHTILPGVIVGIYTPEETLSIDQDDMPVSVEQVVNAAAKPAMAQAIVDEWMDVIVNAAPIDKLKAAYTDAYKAAREIGDEKRMESFQLAYRARKSELEDAQSAEAPSADV